MSGYTPIEKQQIAINYLIPKQIKANGLDTIKVNISNGAIEKIITEYTAESGVRGLEKQISKLLRKAAKEYVESIDMLKPVKVIKITTVNIEKYLGAPIFRHSKVTQQAEIGRATGLAWTSIGGEVLTIEVGIIEGKGEVVLTGKLGEVMRESAKIAVTYIKRNAAKYNIPIEYFSTKDIHVHVPEGAVPKDGPSAGITIATAVLSAFTSLKVKGDFAMTGELTLRGKVLAIGGLKEKTLASHRNGIFNVILPKENERDIAELPDIIKKTVKFYCVENVEEVFDLIFEKNAD